MALYYPTPQVTGYPQQPRMEQPYLGIKGRPVSSIDEVRATSIDFDGSVFYFPDLANKKIYTKQINLDGTATLNVYELKIEPILSTPQFVTKEELESALKEFKETLQEEKKVVTAQKKIEF